MLAALRKAPLLDPYDMHQHFMDYAAAKMQDDLYLIAADSQVKGAQPRAIVQVCNNDKRRPSSRRLITSR